MATERDKAIKKAQQVKWDRIKKFSDFKSLSITITSAYGQAYSLAQALVNTGQIKEKEYWKKGQEFFDRHFKQLSEELEGAKNILKDEEEAAQIAELSKKSGEDDEQYQKRLLKIANRYKIKDKKMYLFVVEKMKKLSPKDGGLPF